MSHSFSYLSSLPLVTYPIAVALNNCARDCLHKDCCMQAFGTNTLSKPHTTPWCIAFQSWMSKLATVIAIESRSWGVRLGVVVNVIWLHQRLGIHWFCMCRESSGSLVRHFKSIEIGFMGFKSFFDVVGSVSYHADH